MKGKISKTTLISILKNFKRIPWILGKYAFFVVLLLIVLDLIFGVWVFYNYVFLIKETRPQITESPSMFQKGAYQQILENWQLRDQKLQNKNLPESF